MNSRRHIPTRRQLAVTLLSIVIAFAAGGSTRDHLGVDHDRVELAEELEGIAGREKSLVNRPGTIEAAFARERYRPGEIATLRLFTDMRRVSIRLFQSGPERIVTRRSDMMFGVEVGSKRILPTARRGAIVRIRIGDWPSGLYFARLWARGGHLGFATFVVAPRRLGESPVAVVLPTEYVARLQRSRRKRRRRR